MDGSAHQQRTARLEEPLVLAGLVAAHVLAWLLAARPTMFPSHFAADVPRMTEIATAGGWPWRDHPVEYPPVTWGLVRLVVGPDNGATIWRLAATQFAADLATAAALAWGWSRRASGAYLALVLPLMAYPFVLVRTDLTAVALVIGGLALARRRRDHLAGLMLALAVAAKVWPIVVLPALALWRRWRSLAATAACGLSGVVVWLGLVGGDALRHVLTFRGSTGVQIESIPGNVASWLGASDERVEQGAVRIGDLPGWLLSGFSVLALAAVAGVWWAASRRDHRTALPQGLAELGAVAALLSAAALFSTQYAVWFVPFLALLLVDLDRRRGWRGAVAKEPAAVVAWVAGGVLVACSTLVYLVLPDVGAGEWPGLLLLTVRNASVLVVLGAVVRSLLTEPLSPNSPRSDRPRTGTPLHGLASDGDADRDG